MLKSSIKSLKNCAFASFDLNFSQTLEPYKDNYEASFENDIWDMREKSERVLHEEIVKVVDGFQLEMDPEESLRQYYYGDQMSEADNVLKSLILDKKSTDR
jgi:hypothetical protein